jgi:CO/xanthine dehydrogenase Mo-binding subunit
MGFDGMAPANSSRGAIIVRVPDESAIGEIPRNPFFQWEIREIREVAVDEVEYDADERDDITYFSAQVAKVQVDRETGQVRVLRLVTAHDVGTIIHPLAHQGQIDGGVITGFGLGVTEEFVTDGGQVVNGNMGDYKLPTMADIPALETVLIQTGGGAGPYEAKTSTSTR